MAKPRKNNTGNKKEKPPVKEGGNNSNFAKQFRMGVGMAGLFIAFFLCIAIVSYFFTWQQDFDKVTAGTDWFTFVFKNKKEVVANWGGRAGAFFSHLLVWEGVGVAALAIALWIGAFGVKLLNSKAHIPVTRYFRWMCIILLVIPPTLSYFNTGASFSFGGAWGNEAINYMNGLFGTVGTGMVLFAVICFFVFVVFALDISPLIRRARKTAQKVADIASSMKPAKTAAETTGATPQPQDEPINVLRTIEGKDKPLIIDEEDEEQEDFGMELVDKSSARPTVNDMYAAQAEPEAEEQEEEIIEEEEEEPTVEMELDIPEKQTTKQPEPDTELSFEVTQKEDERTIPQHGGHISIADNEKYAPELDLPDYKFPTLDLLEERTQDVIHLDKEELEKNKNQIIQTLRSFGIEIQRISATVGPTVTLYEIVPAEGVRISKIRNLEDDIALNLAALGIRIIAPIPGRGTIGIEVPNANKQIVSIRALLASEKFVNSKMSLPIALGKKIDNENYIVDLATMPHLLMAGATGQGKSVGINTILVSLLYKKHPSQLKFIMVDPKKVELSIYRTIEKHFLAKLPDEEEAIITDYKKVIYTLNALCIEMDNRYELLKDGGARNIKEYNDKFIRRRLNPENGHKYLPFIVLVIDEFADLIMTAGKEVEMPIARLAQLARAVGIHLIIATQRPSVNVITGTIKANFPARIAFKVSAKVDSRTILDAGGAEQLIGRGDMLISFGSELLRLQCAFVDTPEVEQVVDYIAEQRGYPNAFELPEYEGEESSSEKSVDLTNRDKLFEDCARVVVQTQSGSTSMLQRRFNLGYNRAGRIMDQLEAADIVGPSAGSKPRDVLVHTEAELEQMLGNL